MFYLEFISDSRGPKLDTARKCNHYESKMYILTSF